MISPPDPIQFEQKIYIETIMRIRTFCKFVEKEELEDHTLKNCTIVIDGQNFFYSLYTKSQLPYIFGCECDKYSAYLKEYLKMFKNANIKCYFVFKGGDKDILKSIETKHSKIKKRNDQGIRNPIFVKDVYKQVLDEIDFEYVISEYESKEDVITLAHKLNCPIMSFDIEYCFCGVPYIPHNDNFVQKHDKELNVGLFTLEHFLKKYNLTKQKLAIFITLTDQKIFGVDFFLPLTRRLRMPLSTYNCNLALLKWLGRTSVDKILHIIYEYVNKDKFNEQMEIVTDFICNTPTPSLAVDFLINRNDFQIIEKDPLWFEKGLAIGNISIPYVNLYRSNIFFGSYVEEDNNANDSILLSIDILIYASNLLSNFKNKEFKFVDKTENILTITSAIQTLQKPEYEALESPFEDGWHRVKAFRLLDYFLETSLQGFNFECLDKIPEDARLLIISLIYFSRKKHTDTTNIVCSVILSYIMLSVVNDMTGDDRSQAPHAVNLDSRPQLDPTTDKGCITESDAIAAAIIMKNYFQTTETEIHGIYDEKKNYPLIEFQHCLGEMNDLSKLCGSSYTPTIYSRTYNGTFVYKVLYAIENNKAGISARDFIMQTLNPAATVVAFFDGIFDTYQELMYT